MKYQNLIPEPGTTISGFADKLKKNNNNNADRPTLDFFWHAGIDIYTSPIARGELKQSGTTKLMQNGSPLD